MTEHRILLMIGEDGSIGGPLASATAVVVADVRGLDIVHWQLHQVAWDRLRSTSESDWRIAAFVRQQRVQALVVDQVPATTRDTLTGMGVAVFERAGISARAAAVSAATVLDLLEAGP